MSMSRPSCISYSNHVPRARTIGLRSCSHAALISADLICTILRHLNSNITTYHASISEQRVKILHVHMPRTHAYGPGGSKHRLQLVKTMYIHNKYGLQEPTSHVTMHILHGFEGHHVQKLLAHRGVPWDEAISIQISLLSLLDKNLNRADKHDIILYYVSSISIYLLTLWGR